MILYPLRFEPIYQYRLWGGHRLAGLLAAPPPNDGPIGEAWILSDREDNPRKSSPMGRFKGRPLVMADNRIGAGRLDLPDTLPPEAAAGPPGEKV